jgi:hypothetical protein
MEPDSDNLRRRPNALIIHSKPSMFISGLRRLIWWFQGSLASRSTDQKVRYIACLDEVIITRNGDFARIEYRERNIAETLLHIGPAISEMCDLEIVEWHNECLRSDARQIDEEKRVAFEVPLGSAQIEYFARFDQWVPRSRVLRCLIQDVEGSRLIVKIDEQELRLKQFAKLLSTYEGWGMRIEFVPEDEVHRRPRLEVREPKAHE